MYRATTQNRHLDKSQSAQFQELEGKKPADIEGPPAPIYIPRPPVVEKSDKIKSRESERGRFYKGSMSKSNDTLLKKKKSRDLDLKLDTRGIEHAARDKQTFTEGSPELNNTPKGINTVVSKKADDDSSAPAQLSDHSSLNNSELQSSQLHSKHLSEKRVRRHATGKLEVCKNTEKTIDLFSTTPLSTSPQHTQTEKLDRKKKKTAESSSKYPTLNQNLLVTRWTLMESESTTKDHSELLLTNDLEKQKQDVQLNAPTISTSESMIDSLHSEEIKLKESDKNLLSLDNFSASSSKTSLCLIVGFR